MDVKKTWIEKKCEESWRFWFLIKFDRIIVWRLESIWYWITNQLVWDFDKYPEGRLMYYRTKEFLLADDPRHFAEIGEDEENS